MAAYQSPSKMAAQLPDDIRIRYIFHSDSVKHQVVALFTEQTNWLVDHLESIRKTYESKKTAPKKAARKGGKRTKAQAEDARSVLLRSECSHVLTLPSSVQARARRDHQEPSQAYKLPAVDLPRPSGCRPEAHARSGRHQHPAAKDPRFIRSCISPHSHQGHARRRGECSSICRRVQVSQTRVSKGRQVSQLGAAPFSAVPSFSSSHAERSLPAAGFQVSRSSCCSSSAV